MKNLVTNGTSKETVRLSTLLKQNAAYVLLPELGTQPNVYYLPAVEPIRLTYNSKKWKK